MITWREFSVLLRGLSPSSVTFLALQPGRTKGHTPRSNGDVITDPAEAERTLRRILG